MNKHPKLDQVTQDQLDAARKQRMPKEKAWAMADAFYAGRQNVSWSAIENNRIIEYPRRRQTNTKAVEYRQTRNRHRPIIRSLVAKYNSRMPGWSVEPDNGDPIAIANARSSEHALSAYYESLSLANEFAETLTLAANLGSAYVYVYWDDRAGRALGDDLYEGEVAIRVLPPSCLLWEAGLKFKESSWHAIEQAFPASYVTERYGIKNPSPDARNNGSMIDNVMSSGADPSANMVMVIERLERPCHGRPGSRKVIVGDRVVKEYPYTYAGEKFAEVASQPWLVEYSYDVNPTGDRPLGVGDDLVELNRAYNATINQASKHKDLKVNPPLRALKGSYKGPSELIPGHLYEYSDPDAAPEPMTIADVGPILDNHLNRIESDFQAVSGQSEVGMGQSPANVDTAGATTALIEQDDSTRSSIRRSFAQSHSAVGLRILLLLRAFCADEQRLLRFTGKAGIEGVQMFKGSQVPKRLDVRVSPSSIEARSRQQVEQMAMSFAQQGWVDPQIAMRAIEAGTAENLFDQFELDISWQERENRSMAALQDTPELQAALEADDEIRAQYQMAVEQAEMLGEKPPEPPPPAGPWRHAREFDNHKIHIDTLNLFRKTEAFDLLPEAVQEAFQKHYEEHENFLAREAARQYDAQQAQAQEQGAANAARPTRERGQPSSPAPQLN